MRVCVCVCVCVSVCVCVCLNVRAFPLVLQLHRRRGRKNDPDEGYEDSTAVESVWGSLGQEIYFLRSNPHDR